MNDRHLIIEGVAARGEYPGRYRDHEADGQADSAEDQKDIQNRTKVARRVLYCADEQHHRARTEDAKKLGLLPQAETPEKATRGRRAFAREERRGVIGYHALE